ncbi:hypothetical protein GH714_007612 [Hevea brasiliensis]|uniref:Uncharacterized protein n=1 Tax=Hevea brasiliensis TaxID=3981 RepID=A0A6A6NG46_HEVBR|nr:hypothetical protein GH714_007612 [Hevea brasiliensis]
MASITDCLKKGEFNWTKAAAKAFDEIKLKITEAPILGHPNFNYVFEVACDASGVGIEVDLVLLPPDIRVSQPAESFAQHIHDLHAEIRRKIALSNENYKLAANKLHARAIGPFSILQKPGSNTYLLDLPKDMNISPVFIVEDLSPYRGTFEPPILPSSVSAGQLVPKSALLPQPRDIIDIVLDDEFVTSSQGLLTTMARGKAVVMKMKQQLTSQLKGITMLSRPLLVHNFVTNQYCSQDSPAPRNRIEK